METLVTNDHVVNRVIGFDLLRAIMVIMLIVFHSGVSFMETTIDPYIWPYKNESTSIIFDGIIGLIHSFRLPTFFIISGFVTEMMYQKYSGKIVLKKRLGRLFLPFLITAISLGPIVYSLFALLSGREDIFSLDIMFPQTGDFKYSLGTTFVWFLYYLIIYNIFHSFYHSIIKKKVIEINSSSSLKFYGQILILYLLVCGILMMWNENSLFGIYNFLPDLGSIGGFALFYITGILLYRKIGDLQRIKKIAWPFLFLGLISIMIYFYIGFLNIDNNINPFEFKSGLMIFSTLAAILFSFSSLGLAMKYYVKPNRTVSYISKSSYFIYLIHLPFVLIFLDFIEDYTWNAITKFTVVLVLTIAVSMLINHIWIKAWRNKPPI